VDNIEMDLRETGWGGMDFIDVAQDRDQWRALVNMVMDLQAPCTSHTGTQEYGEHTILQHTGYVGSVPGKWDYNRFLAPYFYFCLSVIICNH
jgi:hypothetical protein